MGHERLRTRRTGVGAGQMGRGIAQVAAATGFDVVLCDATRELAEAGKAQIAAILGKQVDKGKLKAEERQALLDRIETAKGTWEGEGGACMSPFGNPLDRSALPLPGNGRR
jgi:NAD(P)-dependent dehydrogenase (short-subunit alcohol dehydrogenase family)